MNLTLKLLILLVTLIGCRRATINESFFFERRINKTIACDTVFNPRYKDARRVVFIYEQADDSIVTYNGQSYHRYRLSFDGDMDWMLARVENEKMYIIPEDVLQFPKRYGSEELMIDFNTKPGKSWTVGQGGILGNSIYTLDSIDNNSRYLMSAKNVFEIDDGIFVKRLVLTKDRGVEELIFVNLGDTIKCRCDPKFE